VQVEHEPLRLHSPLTSSKLNQSTADLKTASSKVADLQSQMLGLERKLDSAVKELALRKDVDADARSKRTDELAAQLATLQAESSKSLAQKESQVKELQDSFAEETARTKQATKQADDLRASLSTSQEALKKCRKDLTAAVARRNQLESEFSCAQSTVETLTKDLVASKASLASASANLATSQSTVVDLREKLATTSALHETQIKERWDQIAAL
jgi:chromosome segregation ATPase